MLMDKLANTEDVVTLGRWAHHTYIHQARELDPEMKKVLLDIAQMETDPMIEHTTEELIKMAQDMIDAES